MIAVPYCFPHFYEENIFFLVIREGRRRSTFLCRLPSFRFKTTSQKLSLLLFMTSIFVSTQDDLTEALAASLYDINLKQFPSTNNSGKSDSVRSRILLLYLL